MVSLVAFAVMISVVLFEPEIPPNTGSIMRLCANTGASLHLVEPLGFELSDTRLKRAGLDYREYADVHVHADLGSAREALRDRRWLAFTTRAHRGYSDIDYHPDDVLLFGPETRGLPAALLDEFDCRHRLRIPMRANRRSLNLANACAIAVYEAWRQLGFPGAS